MLNLIARLAETGHQVWFGESDTVTVTQVSGESRVVSAPAYITLNGQLDKDQVMAWVKLSGMQNATRISEL